VSATLRAPRLRRVRSALRGVPLAAWLCALVAFANATAWALITPPLEIPDEEAHIYYVQQLAETGQVPKTTGPETISAQANAVRVFSHLDDINVSFLARPAWTQAEGRIVARQVRSLSPVGGGGSVGVGLYPPLYYATLVIPYAATKAVGGSLPSTSTVALRVSPPNMASSPKIAPGRSSVSVITRPSEWRRVTRAAPDRTTKQVSPTSPSRNTTCPAS
jgi:hypothetical protein